MTGAFVQSCASWKRHLCAVIENSQCECYFYRTLRRGGSAPSTLSLALDIDGQEVQTRSVTIDPDGSATVAFQPVTLSQPHTRGTIRLPDDDLNADNAHHFVLSPGNALSVLVVESGSAAQDISLYLRGALEISEDSRFTVRTRRANSVRPADLDAVALMRRAHEHSLLLEPGDVYFAEHDPPKNCFRLGFSSISSDRIQPGIELLARLIQRDD